jgi:hypothetical protein
MLITKERELRNGLFEAILTQAARAARQSNKKVTDYLSDLVENIREEVGRLHANDPHYSLAAENLLSTLTAPSQLNDDMRYALISLGNITLACIHLTSFARAICPEFSTVEKNPPQYYLKELRGIIPGIADVADSLSQGSYGDFQQRNSILREIFNIVKAAVQKDLLHLWALVKQIDKNCCS